MQPFGNLYGLPTCVDKRLTQEDYIVFEAGTHTDAIKVNDRGYKQIVKPRVEDLAIKVHPHPASLILQVKKIGVQCGCGLPLYRARIIFSVAGKPNSRTWSVGEQRTIHERSGHTRTTDASPTTSSTYYSGLNCVMLRWGQRFGSGGFRA